MDLEVRQKKFNPETVTELSRSLDGKTYSDIPVPELFKKEVDFALISINRVRSQRLSPLESTRQTKLLDNNRNEVTLKLIDRHNTER